MSRYSLKVKFDDVELNFDAQEPTRIANQMDNYLEMVLGGKPKIVENHMHQEPAVPEISGRPKEDEKETILSIPLDGNESFSEVLGKVRNIDEELPLTLFMQRKASNSLFDDFIITAFFLKNVLNQESFTIKSLNLNLYSAANKLVDFEILNEALKCGYVRIAEVKDPNEPTRYAITPNGEGYYNKLEDI